MRRRGFTLLEVLVAIALVGALFGSMLVFSLDMLSSRRAALDHAATQLAAATLIERLESELMTSLVGDTHHGAGIEGDGTRLRVLSRGVAVDRAGEGVATALGDLQASEYRFDEVSRAIEGRRGAGGDETGDFVTLGGTVGRLRFRYHDGTAWRDDYDSLAENRLPVAVEVAVWYRPWPGEQDPETLPDEAAPERLTFDGTGGFDEREFAFESDRDLFDEPRPDRIRVILVPDGAGDDAASTGDEGMLTARRP